jgi:hypothetical protein
MTTRRLLERFRANWAPVRVKKTRQKTCGNAAPHLMRESATSEYLERLAK